MTEKPAPATSTVRSKVSTGYGRLDEALQGGFLAGSMIVLNAPASDEVPILLRRFLQSEAVESLLVCRTLSTADNITHDLSGVRSLVCSDKPIPPSKDTIPGKGIENLTDLNFQITDALGSVQPKRIVLDILSDVLLRHKGLQTRKWLTELLERFRSKGITTLAVLNPYMHANEDVQAVVDLFDGNLEIFENDVDGSPAKFMRVKWMHGVEAAEKEFMLTDLASGNRAEPATITVPVKVMREPHWTTPLISRSEELAKLKKAFGDAIAARSVVVGLRGEAGVGKTRLMHELAAYAQTKDAVVLYGNASADELPYAPWTEIARQYVGQSPGELLRRMLGANASELVKLVPDITAKLGTISPPKPLGEQQDKIRFYEAVTQFFVSICGDKPLLLLFDDMQYVDQSSLELLEYFVRGASNLRALIVCSLPGEQEIEANSPLDQTVMKFNRQRLLETVAVKNLSVTDTSRLIQDIFDENAVSQEFVELIFNRTAGNPFFVEEVLRALVEDGTIFRTDKGWDRRPIQEIVMPKSVKNALKSRLTRVDHESLSVLQWAAVIGSDFDFEILVESCQVKEDAVFATLEKTVSQGLVIEVPREKSRFRFADNRVREALLDDLLRMKRARCHLRVAEVMEKFWANNLESHSETIATHYSEGGDLQRAIKYSIMAGERNRSIHAYHPAISNFKRALELMTVEEGGKSQRAEVLEKLGEVDRFGGKVTESIEAQRKALEIFECLQDNSACARVSASLAETLYLSRGIEATREVPDVLMKGLKFLENESQSSEAASIYAALADYYSLQDNFIEAKSWLDKAVAVGERTGNFHAQIISLANRAYLCADFEGDLDTAIQQLKHALDVAFQHDQDADASLILFQMVGYTYLRELREARTYAGRLVEHARHVGDLGFEARGLAGLWLIDWLGGNWDSASKELQEALAIKERVELFSSYLIEGWRCWFSLTKGDLDAAEKYANLALAKEDPKITHLVVTNLSAALVQLELGGEEKAMLHLQRCVEAFKKSEYTTMPLLHAEALMHLSTLKARHGEFKEASISADWARRLAMQLKSDAGLAMASQAEGNILLQKGDPAAAAQAYVKCLELWEKANWPYYRAKALVAYSEALAHTNPEESKKRLQQAADMFRKLGAKRDLEKAEAKLISK